MGRQLHGNTLLTLPWLLRGESKDPGVLLRLQEEPLEAECNFPVRSSPEAPFASSMLSLASKGLV